MMKKTVKKDQIKIKFVKFNNHEKQCFTYPKPYVFNLTPAGKQQFGKLLKPKARGVMHNAFTKTNDAFEVVACGHFDEQTHQPIQIIRMKSLAKKQTHHASSHDSKHQAQASQQTDKQS